MESKIKDENYYVVHGWLKNCLGLKGTKRDIYAIIFGFSQDGECEFTGSIKYFEEWLDVSRPTIIKALQELTESGLIIKRTDIINGVQFNRYKANLQVVKKFNGGSKEILIGGSKEILHNKDNTIEIKEKIKNIVEYLNSVCGTAYRTTSAKTQTLINARLNEGFTFEDFKTVIDKKSKEWKGTEMEQYLRPETLFGTKFESYLNAKINKKCKKALIGGAEVERREYTDAQFESLFTDLGDE